MLSRVADNLYWMSRYMERAEQTARLLDVHLALMLDQLSSSAPERWHRLLMSLCLDRPEQTEFNAYEITRSMTVDPTNSASIVSCVAAARENCRQVRADLSSEVWESMNRLYLMLRQTDFAVVWNTGISEFFRSVRDGAHLLHGTTESTLIREEGFLFIEMGRYLERALMTIALLEAYDDIEAETEGTKDNPVHLDYVALLRCRTGFEAYCRTYTAALRRDKILEFLILDANFPHTVRFCLDKLDGALKNIACQNPGWDCSATERLAGKLRAAVTYTDVNEILEHGVGDFLGGIRADCERMHALLYQVFIGYGIEKELAS